MVVDTGKVYYEIIIPLLHLYLDSDRLSLSGGSWFNFMTHEGFLVCFEDTSVAIMPVLLKDTEVCYLSTRVYFLLVLQVHFTRSTFT